MSWRHVALFLFWYSKLILIFLYFPLCSIMSVSYLGVLCSVLRICYIFNTHLFYIAFVVTMFIITNIFFINAAELVSEKHNNCPFVILASFCIICMQNTISICTMSAQFSDMLQLQIYIWYMKWCLLISSQQWNIAAMMHKL